MNISNEIEKIIRQQQRIGCGDHSCYNVRPVGQGTNGGCRCAMTASNEILHFIMNNESEFLKQLEFAKNYAKNYLGLM